MPLSIVPNLMVADLPLSLGFYQRILGMDVKFIVDGDKKVTETCQDGVFAILEREGAELMLQTEQSLTWELENFFPDVRPEEPLNPTGTIYFRGINPWDVLPLVEAEDTGYLQGPIRTWYGMTELYFSDPDSHVICVAIDRDVDHTGKTAESEAIDMGRS